MKNNNTKAYFAAILNALIIGLSFLFTKLALNVTNPLNILAHRFTVSFIAASVPVLLGWIKLNISRKDILSILPLALFYPALFFSFQAFGLVYISSSEAGIIQAIVPVFTMILATIFLGENINLLQKISLMLSVGGVIYIFLMKGINLGSASFAGIVLIVLSAFSSACYNVMARKKTKKYKPADLSYIMIVIGFLSFNTISVADNMIRGTLADYFVPLTKPIFLISILYLGILSSLITSLLANYSLSKMDATKMSVFANLSTLITMIAGVIFLHEELKSYHAIGAIMIIIGIIGTNFLGSKKYKY
ncbi:DMT family transporter [Lachnoclostridium phytofermentans]|uniref:EamA domain-containing protein n=1 Tax=Lachnoclostridium phytofermentans (strain ATCC 700394 / DSM 18823 / ISDg) TaxID=357809 RepID=A9KPS2_LACP7|nr:DMT family transporter [Lachnoclostridium phytofermentans]ABX41821.1 protein of unknown function DUF6 transmembrane [Lachnoclostridium phytofermentans ISDg]